MWPQNFQNINNLNTRQLSIEQNNNNINEPGPIYQTPIKQSLNANGNNETPLQFDFNYYFGNLWSSGHIPLKNIEIPMNNSVTQHNKETNMYIFKSSLDKSGYKLTPVSEIKNSNIIEYGISNNMNNIYENENELNPNQFTKKNLNELFNKAKNYQFLQTKKGYTSNNNIIDNNNFYYYNNINNNGNNNIFDNNNTNHNLNDINNYEFEGDNKENKNFNNINNNIIDLSQKIENKKINIVNNRNSPLSNSKLNNKGEDKFSSPKNKKPKKIFECSGSTLATNSSKLSTRKRRFRKNNEQLIILSQFFNENKHWSKNQIKEISQKTGLKENKVYKWLWDQKNKEYKASKFIVNKKNI